MTNELRARVLNWDACLNARDLGGYPTGDGGQTRWGVCVRADTLSRLTSVGRTALLDYGVRTIIDVRRADELQVDPVLLPGEQRMPRCRSTCSCRLGVAPTTPTGPQSQPLAPALMTR